MVIEQQVQINPAIIATDVTAEDYLSSYASDFHEWVEGDVIKMSPVHIRHDGLSRYLIVFFETHLAFVPAGKIAAAPFVMRMDERHYRESDLQIILNASLDRLKPTFVEGAADICIEIVSPGSIETDYVTKFAEYEQAGVKEYWLLDDQRRDALFYRLDDTGHLVRHYQDHDEHYRTPLLPKFALHIPTLWRETLPNPVEVMETIRNLTES